MPIRLRGPAGRGSLRSVGKELWRGHTGLEMTLGAFLLWLLRMHGQNVRVGRLSPNLRIISINWSERILVNIFLYIPTGPPPTIKTST